MNTRVYVNLLEGNGYIMGIFWHIYRGLVVISPAEMHADWDPRDPGWHTLEVTIFEVM